MNNIRIATYGFPGALSELIARGSMNLPPLSGDAGAQFLRTTLGVVTLVFWSNYIADLPDAAKKEFVAILQSEDGAGYDAWLAKNANVTGDIAAEQRANRVLADLEAKLPALMAEEYGRFRSEIAA